MALPAFPADIAAFLAALNSNPFDATDNPEGLAEGGHRQLFPEAMNSTAEMAAYFAAVGAEILALADQVAINAESAASGSGSESTTAQIWAGAAAQYLSIRRIMAAQERQVIAFASPLAWNMATGINFKCTLTGNTTLPNASNQVAGKSGFIDFIQDGTGGRSLTSYGANYKWFGPRPDWPTAGAAITKISYFVAAPGEVHLAWAGNAT